MKDFAPDYPRNEQGWIKFPSDVSYRATMFPTEVNKHPAKANAILIREIVEYVSEPGGLITITPEILAELDSEIDWCSH